MNKPALFFIACILILVVFQLPIARDAHKYFQEPLLAILKESIVSSSTSLLNTPARTAAEPAEQHAAAAIASPQNKFTGPPAGDDHFCVLWEVNTDEWWTHHPTWAVSAENNTHTCFAVIESETDRNLLQAIYNNQWRNNNTDPSSVLYTRQMMNSGWAADFTNVAFGLIKGMEENRPFAVREAPELGFWHYAANKKDGSNPTCPSKNLTCYFLPMGAYEGATDDAHVDFSQWMPKRTWFRDQGTAYRYVTRQQQWVRRAVYDAVQKMDTVIVPPCTVLHVRRSDVVLHHQLSRKYFPISAYVDLIPNDRGATDTLFLLTDDANAIDEAHEFYPDLKWRYFNRTRYRAAEGGWEMQVPSNSPKKEVLVILTTFALAGRCNVFIHSKSKFSNSIRQAMPHDTRAFMVDKGEHPFDANNSVSHLELQKTLEEKRRQKQQQTGKQQGQQAEQRQQPGDDKYVTLSKDQITVGRTKTTVKATAKTPNDFCVPWELNSDEWWTHHPEWRVTFENDTHTCFSFFDDYKAKEFRKIYDNQFQNKNNCSKVHTRHMWSSGWGSDLTNVVYGLESGREDGIPFALKFKRYKPWWHYSANKKDASNATCPEKDFACNFLPLTNCKPQKIEDDPMNKQYWSNRYNLLYNYTTRTRQWLRKSIHEQYSLMDANITTPCTVVHVRRSDVVLHVKRSRQYFALSTYVDHMPANRKNETIFLLTDDANAIDEAHEFYPDLKWTYLNRKRWRGTEGGWENQTPSRSPKLEIAIIMATLRLVQRCDTIVHSASEFATTLKRFMNMGQSEVTEIAIDEKLKFEQLYSFNNAISHTRLNATLHELRQKKQKPRQSRRLR